MKHSLLIFIFFLLIVNTSCFSQTMVLQVDRSRDSIPSERGPNMQKFGCLFMGAGLPVSGDEEGAKIKYGSSGELYLGYRAKYKVSPIYSLGWEIMLHWQYYKLSQISGKILPDSLLHDVERFDISSIGASFYNRFNFDPKRGDYLGNFLDIGITGEWFYDFDHLTKDNLPDGTRLKASQTKLSYSNHFGEEVFARFGLNTLSLTARYRFSDLFKSSYSYPELPRLMVGLEVAIFR